MKTNNKIWILILLSLMGCSKNQAITELKVSFLPPYTSTPTNVNCEILNQKNFTELDSLSICDSKKINDFNLIFEKLEVFQELNEDDKTNQDIRIKIVIYYNNTPSDVLCLGEFYGVYLNGELYKDNPALLKFIKYEIYNHMKKLNLNDANLWIRAY